MDFNVWAFILENLEAAGAIGGYVSISIIGVALITYATRKKNKGEGHIGPKWTHPLIGASLGVIPGCGGTIVVASMFKNKKISFGGLFAAFTATLGEGSFVLLGASDEAQVKANLTAFAIVNIIGFFLGLILGYAIDAFGIRVKTANNPEKVNNEPCDESKNNSLAHRFIKNTGFYLILAIAVFLAPGSIMALWGGSIEAIADLTVWVTIAFTLVSIVYYLVYKFILKEDCCFFDYKSVRSTLVDSVADITMVIVYVFIGLFVVNFIIDVMVGVERFEVWMTSAAWALVIIAAFIGVIPGCGGMIAVAVAYITIPGFPMAALIAAGIATSGDGIFPLLAQNRKDAVIVSGVGLAVAIAVGYAALALGI
jgi:hypothetical protein